ncbi:MAG TPA: hypothetical protein PLT09_06630 [Deltaproteobacteria bacterium]|nr:hypothetical protein [Deltaproteobacteria bacterium]HPR53582.1 hypothetical protein [Deltaproteobacteria bacterium]HXK47097.1 hypothetical protein [Deltaproteobacteria bacterium]
MSPWLFLHEGKCPPSLTMETDLELFEAVRNGIIPGALRLYDWAEPAVTTGFHQKSFELHDKSLVLPVLQRPTGGGAVLHGDDITFSISTPVGGIFPGSIPECSLVISRVFAATLNMCGLDVRIKGGDHAFSPVCFTRPSPVELLSEDGKVMGLAMARKGSYMLVQGVIPLKVDQEMALKVFGPGNVPENKGLLDVHPSFHSDGFFQALGECLGSQLGVLLQEGKAEDHQHGGTYSRQVEPGR